MPPGDVNQLTINAGMFDLTIEENCFKGSPQNSEKIVR
ncbi:hypothetical protein AC77_5253 [Escherichia coli 5-366-08_S4_C1]|nr:hypothetical protein AC77_5253 [Escherichia coli 5-366-08_S4_C1]